MINKITNVLLYLFPLNVYANLNLSEKEKETCLIVLIRCKSNSERVSANNRIRGEKSKLLLNVSILNTENTIKIKSSKHEIMWTLSRFCPAGSSFC